MNSAAWMSFRSAAEQPDYDDGPPAWKPGPYPYVKCGRCGRFVARDALEVVGEPPWGGTPVAVLAYPCRCGEQNIDVF